MWISFNTLLLFYCEYLCGPSRHIVSQKDLIVFSSRLVPAPIDVADDFRSTKVSKINFYSSNNNTCSFLFECARTNASPNSIAFSRKNGILFLNFMTVQAKRECVWTNQQMRVREAKIEEREEQKNKNKKKRM